MEGHTGACSVVREFGLPWLREMATKIENLYGPEFEKYRGRFRIRPIRVTHFRQVGEGFTLELVPLEPDPYTWAGEFEADLEVRLRQRFSRQWKELVPPAEVERWMHIATKDYLDRVQTLA